MSEELGEASGSASPSAAQSDTRRTAFTPGPWIPSKFGFQVVTGDGWSTVCTLKGAAEWEDGRGKRTPAYEWENQEANARLIAAAPDFYSAAAHLIEAWDARTTGAQQVVTGNSDRDLQKRAMDAIEGLRAALAKVTDA